VRPPEGGACSSWIKHGFSHSLRQRLRGATGKCLFHLVLPRFAPLGSRRVASRRRRLAPLATREARTHRKPDSEERCAMTPDKRNMCFIRRTQRLKRRLKS
jgi:hypothetical protein